MKHRFDAQDPVEALVGEGELAGIGGHPSELVMMQRFELSTDVDLTRIDVESYQRHAAETSIDVLHCPTEPTAYVQHALPGVQVGHLDEHLGEPLDRAVDVLDPQRLASSQGKGIIPVSHMDKSIGQTMVKSVDEKIEVRWDSGLHSHPQRFITCGSMLNVMKRYRSGAVRHPGLVGLNVEIDQQLRGSISSLDKESQSQAQRRHVSHESSFFLPCCGGPHSVMLMRGGKPVVPVKVVRQE